MDKCEFCKFGTSKEDCIVFNCQNCNKFSPITNLEYLCRNKKELAELLVGVFNNPEDGFDEFYTTDGKLYYDFDQAVSDQIEWLNKDIDLDVYSCQEDKEVDIIFCNECIKWKTDNCPMMGHYEQEDPTDPDDFCSYAEKLEEYDEY